MMKVLLLLGLLALVETRWVRSDSPFESVNERELGEEGSQLQALVISKFLRSLEKRLGKEEINWADSSEDHSSENYAQVALTIPPPTPQEWTAFQKGNSLKHAVDNTSKLHRRGTTFKYKYVQSNGVISSTYTSGPSIEVAATLDVSDNAHKVAATTIARMTKHMPPSIFQTLTALAKVGVFTKAETLTVYLEYKELASPPGCESSCSGYCKKTCTFDGRKYSSLAGVGGIRAVVVDNSILCNSNDPYKQQSNILVHEFSHTIHSYGLTWTLKDRITSAYAHAKAYSKWESDAYSMANEQEYFAEATQSFFSADKLSYSTGGMNTCGRTFCQREEDERQHIREIDPELYAILSEVYTNNRSSLPGNIGVCTTILA